MKMRPDQVLQKIRESQQTAHERKREIEKELFEGITRPLIENGLVELPEEGAEFGDWGEW